MSQNHAKTMQILPAVEGDLEAISRLAGVIWRAHYPGIISAEQIEYMLERMYSCETLRDEIGRGGIRYDRLFVEGQLIGFAAYGPTENPEIFKLHKLYLLPQWHGQGLGTLLLQHCTTEAAKSGAVRLILTVNKGNTKAIEAYRRNGFAPVDSVVTDIGGGFVMDDFVFAKAIS